MIYTEAEWEVPEEWKPIVRECVEKIHSCGCSVVQVCQSDGELDIRYRTGLLGASHWVSVLVCNAVGLTIREARDAIKQQFPAA